MSDLRAQLNPDSSRNADRVNDFLLPEQRLDAIAEILATITTRIINKHHDQNNFPSEEI